MKTLFLIITLAIYPAKITFWHCNPNQTQCTKMTLNYQAAMMHLTNHPQDFGYILF